VTIEVATPVAFCGKGDKTLFQAQLEPAAMKS
jgi:hypothetical protein